MLPSPPSPASRSSLRVRFALVITPQWGADFPVSGTIAIDTWPGRGPPLRLPSLTGQRRSRGPSYLWRSRNSGASNKHHFPVYPLGTFVLPTIENFFGHNTLSAGPAGRQARDGRDP